ncbi:uroporphyrinogen-III C-methyltransferase [Methanocalculus taiwanensis]|uniref:uroporphyrinogen-III C-methyltransferase n=1 Tax=Methanocalculus taiwanensis TaxID=106207 RepID=A0ABD4TNX7_9EURY|nr:uroporphyrinogen-III C-methyltransferase [Methanocalculus taiwanensis]MCQ1539560.1 uroporphyrinogen-III C-methyltransferase [Methanocalculus taiwanensis]
MNGIVYLVGSGPGGLGLLTFRAREVIDSADVILYDQLPGDEILATLPASAEKINCGKFGGSHTMKQEEIESLMVERAHQGKRVVRLKGGDPFVFGRGGEEMEVLREQNIDVEVVPGITSAVAVPECSGIPVTHRSHASQVTFLTGHEDPTKEESAIDWEWLARSPGTIVILMGVKNLDLITASLMKHGMPGIKPVAIIERGFRQDQRVTIGSLSDITEKARATGVAPPAIIVIGDVVSLYRDGSEGAWSRKNTNQ